LQSGDGSFEVKDLPESDSEIQDPNATDRAAHPTGSDDGLQSMTAGLAGSIQQKIVIAPVADAPHAVRPPRRHREKDSNLEAEDDVKDNA